MKKKKNAKKENSKGVIYYNVGHKMLVCLAVSAHTLRKVYDGPATILADDRGYDECKRIAKGEGLDIQRTNLPTVGKNTAMLNKCMLAEATPYDVSVYFDLDTIILDEFDHLFKWAEDWEFVTTEFCHWTTKTKRIRGRIDEWSDIYPEAIEGAHKYHHAINTGVMAFRRDSKWYADWYKKALPGQQKFIPDEKVCQVLLHKYPHYIADQTYNTSCRYGDVSRARVIHFHGRKHCRIGDSGEYQNNSDIWYARLADIEHKPYVSDNIQHDRMLRKHIKNWPYRRGSNAR